MAREFAKEKMLPHAASWEEDKVFPVDVLREAAGLGFGGLYVPEEYGGSGLGRLDGAIIFEGLAYGDISTAAYLTIHNMVAYVVSKFGSPALKSTFLPRLTSMSSLASYCLTEPGSGSDAASLATTATPVEGGWILSGSKAFISGAGASDVYLVMARCQGKLPSSTEAATAAAEDTAAAADAAAGGSSSSGSSGPLPPGVPLPPAPADGDVSAKPAAAPADSAGAISAFLVDGTSPGVTFGAPERKMGWRSQPTASVHLDKVFVPSEALVGQQGQGFKIAMHALDGGRINIAACSVGGAAFCLDYAWQYANERKQFGQPVGAFQASQFKLADMATGLEASRVMVRQAAAALDAQSPRATLTAAMAKRFATDTCFGVANDALQLLGGYGYLQDYPVERYLRDLRVHSILEGTNEIMRLIIHRQLGRLDHRDA